MIIIGITGTLGAGKGTVVDYLVEKQGFKHYSARSFIYEEIDKRGLERNIDNLKSVANELRANYKPSYIAEQLYERAQKLGENAVIESLRTPGEINALRKQGGCYIFAIDAEPKIRYDRLSKRYKQMDFKTYDEFVVMEKSQMQTSDPNKQNLGKCIEMADYKFENNETIPDLHLLVEKVLKELNL